MKKYNKFLIIILLPVFLSCSEDFDIKTNNSYNDQLTWSLPDKAEGVLLNAYNGLIQLPDGWSGSNFLDVATDNAVTNDFASGLYRLTAGGITAQNNPIDRWEVNYKYFQYIHLFLENGLNNTIKYDLYDPEFEKSKRNRLKGEAFFLRAWWAFDLLQQYGGLTEEGVSLGYPIVLHSLSDNFSGSNKLARNSYEDCVSQIAADCDSAIKYLPVKYSGSDGIIGSSQLGRASGRAAYALKSRLYTYAASPAYRKLGTSEDEITEKWIRAAQASILAITDASLGNYTGLVEANLSGKTLKDATPDEFLFWTWSNSNNLEKRQFPPSFFGQGKTNPSQNLVNAFPMLNGYPITDIRSGYNPQQPYVNRDKRFDLTVYYHGRIFNNERLIDVSIDETGNPGRDAAGYEYRNTRTGYYVRKWMSTIKNMLYDSTTLISVKDYHQYPLLRRSEVYLNLAEALNEAVGPTGTVLGSSLTAVSIINSVRAAAGITSHDYVTEVAALGKVAFRNLILNERRIEFAFENMRYFDLRRWLLPLNESVNGVQITKTATGLIFQGTDPSLPSIEVEKRLLDNEKYYYAPIPYNEIVKNSALIQNKGW